MVALAITALQFFALRLPTVLLTVIFVSCMLAFLGVVGVCWAVLVALSIVLAEDDGNRGFNLARCLDLAIVGLLAIVPLVTCITALLTLR